MEPTPDTPRLGDHVVITAYHDGHRGRTGRVVQVEIGADDQIISYAVDLEPRPGVGLRAIKIKVKPTGLAKYPAEVAPTPVTGGFTMGDPDGLKPPSVAVGDKVRYIGPESEFRRTDVPGIVERVDLGTVHVRWPHLRGLTYAHKSSDVIPWVALFDESKPADPADVLGMWCAVFVATVLERAEKKAARRIGAGLWDNDDEVPPRLEYRRLVTTEDVQAVLRDLQEAHQDDDVPPHWPEHDAGPWDRPGADPVGDLKREGDRIKAEYDRGGVWPEPTLEFEHSGVRSTMLPLPADADVSLMLLIDGDVTARLDFGEKCARDHAIESLPGIEFLLRGVTRPMPIEDRTLPLLGLATTREMLLEVEARCHTQGLSDQARSFREMVEKFPDRWLDYRTVEPRLATGGAVPEAAGTWQEPPSWSVGGSGVSDAVNRANLAARGIDLSNHGNPIR